MKKQVLRICAEGDSRSVFSFKRAVTMAGIRVKSFSAPLLAIMLILSIIAFLPSTFVVAKPVGPNPDAGAWPGGTIWGTVLHMENVSFVGEAWFGAKTGSEYTSSFSPPPGSYIYPLFNIGGSSYDTDVKTNVAAPQHFSWYVELRRSGSGAPENATISSVMESVDTWFVPQDFSVVLDNSAQGIFVNLRTGSAYITGLTKYATLYVDNAVNIQSIDNLDPLIGKAGDNLRLRVTVKNTGRYTDNYVVSAGGSLDPTIPNLAPGNTDNVIVTTTIPTGTENIVITAAGNYATDQDYITATGVTLIRGVSVSITPPTQENDNGGTLKYDVLVKNLGNVLENFQLTKGDNAGWTLSLDNSWLLVPQGENRITKLTVTIPASAIGGTFDNIWVKATSKDNTAVFDNESCLAHVRVVGIAISATIDVDPDTLNLKSKGNWITAYIELPSGYDVKNIDVKTVRLIVGKDNVPAENWPTSIGDYDNDGKPDLMVKFSRSAVQQFLIIGVNKVTVVGKVAGVPFEGKDNIKVIGTPSFDPDDISNGESIPNKGSIVAALLAVTILMGIAMLIGIPYVRTLRGQPKKRILLGTPFTRTLEGQSKKRILLQISRDETKEK